MVRFRAGPAAPALPRGVTTLLMVERALARPRSGERAGSGAAALFDRIAPEAAAWWSAADPVDAVIDLTGTGAPAAVIGGPAVLRPVFDGDPSEAALVAAILSGAMPEIAVLDGLTGRPLAAGSPSPENGGGLTGGLDAVLSRTLLLIESLVAAPRRPKPLAAHASRRHAGRAPAAVLARALAREAAYAAYKLCMYTPHWRVGWRLHEGSGVLERRDLGGPAWRTLADPGYRFFADPFPVVWEGRTAIFVEDFDHRVGKAVISVTEIAGNATGPVVPVLEEPWHLSYPFLLVEDGVLHMVPEASVSGEIALYRCTGFPTRWERCATLIAGVEAADATVFRHDGRYWLMAVTREGTGGFSDTLRIWHAPRLLGPWEEHGLRPVMVDIATARPGGNVVVHGGALWRPFQDCTDGYGRALGLARIDRLDPDHYDETVVARIAPGPAWPGRRVHTLNRAGALECIDGSAFMPRLPLLRPWMAARLRPQPNTGTRGRDAAE